MDPTAGSIEEPAGEAIAGGDRCSSCEQPLASDQRYCISCGQRRGKARFSFEQLAGPATAPARPSTKSSRRPRLAQGIGFIAGVATLLLAMGVGVLIGHNGDTSKVQQAAAPGQQVIKIEGVGGSSGSKAPARVKHNSNPTTANNNYNASNPTLPVTKLSLTPKQTQAVNKAVTNVLGHGASNLAPPTVEPGSPCSHGAGCQGGKFTGNFFGGGQN
jgi:hypothetical protein